MPNGLCARKFANFRLVDVYFQPAPIDKNVSAVDTHIFNLSITEFYAPQTTRDSLKTYIEIEILYARYFRVIFFLALLRD